MINISNVIIQHVLRHSLTCLPGDVSPLTMKVTCAVSMVDLEQGKTGAAAERHPHIAFNETHDNTALALLMDSK